jgi:hypothetical protein
MHPVRNGKRVIDEREMKTCTSSSLSNGVKEDFSEKELIEDELKYTACTTVSCFARPAFERPRGELGAATSPLHRQHRASLRMTILPQNNYVPKNH